MASFDKILLGGVVGVLGGCGIGAICGASLFEGDRGIGIAVGGAMLGAALGLLGGAFVACGRGPGGKPDVDDLD